MRWIDVTLPMREEMPCWPGDLPFSHKITGEIGKNGSECNLSTISCSVHFGTHVDSPYHFIENGKRIEELDIDLLVGDCQVLEVNGKNGVIAVEELKDKIIPGTKRLLVKSPNSRMIQDREFHKDFIGFSVDAIKLIVEKGIKLLGLDYYSIAPFKKGGEAHRIFLGNNDAVAVEGVDLSNVEPGTYHLVCLPMKIEGAGGAPARVLLGITE